MRSATLPPAVSASRMKICLDGMTEVEADSPSLAQIDLSSAPPPHVLSGTHLL